MSNPNVHQRVLGYRSWITQIIIHVSKDIVGHLVAPLLCSTWVAFRFSMEKNYLYNFIESLCLVCYPMPVVLDKYE